MPVSLAQRASAHSDVAMAVYLEPWLRGSRVAFVGPRLKALARVREVADGVHALRIDAPDGRLVPVRRRRDGNRGARSKDLGRAPRWPEGELDVVFITELDAAAEPDALLADAARAIRPEGVVVVGGTSGHDDLRARMAGRFQAVDMLGELPFAAYAVFRCGETGAGDEPVLLDDSLAGRRERVPERFWAVGSAEARALDAFAVIQVPRDALPARELASPAERVPDTVAHERELSRLEAHLVERAAALRESEGEVRRRGVLVRDILERAAESGSEQGTATEELLRLRQERDAAVSRAVEAEVARTESQFRLDEVAGHLATLRADAGRLQEAGGSHDVAAQDDERSRMEGRLRGLLARNAELEEAHETAYARRILLEQDLGEARRRLQDRRPVPPDDVTDWQRLSGWRAGALLAAGERAAALSAQRDRLVSRNRDLEERLAGLAAERESLEETLVVARGEAESRERWAREKIDGLKRALDEARAALASLGDSMSDSMSSAGSRGASGPMDVPDPAARTPSEDGPGNGGDS